MIDIYLVFDIGGTFTKFFLTDVKATTFKKGKFLTPKSSLEGLLNSMFSVVTENLNLGIDGISICCPGIVDSKNGIVYSGGNVSVLHQVQLKKIFQEKYNIPVSIENDGKAAALSEIWTNKNGENDTVVVLVLGTGIGGGIIINGQLLRGKNFSAGEVSYMIEHISEETQQVKLFGYETSAPVMLEKIKIINNLSNDSEGEEIFSYITPDNKESWTIFLEYCSKVASMIISLQHVIDPDRFVIGGGITKQEVVVKQIQKQLEILYDWDHPKFLTVPVIKQSNNLDEANFLGALYNLLIEYNLEEAEVANI